MSIEGDDYSSAPPDTPHLRSTENWQNIFENWGQWSTAAGKRKIMEMLCTNRGIPSGVRGRYWFMASGAHELMRRTPNAEGLFDKLAVMPPTEHERVIRADIDRTFAHHPIFSNSPYLQDSLYQLLNAYCHMDDTMGYTQSMSFVGAMLLLHLPLEPAFWTFATLCRRHMDSLYKEEFQQVIRDSAIFRILAKKHYRRIERSMTDLNLHPTLLVIRWFFPIFLTTIPWQHSLRLWDIFVLDGMITLHKCGLLLLKYLKPRLRIIRTVSDIAVLQQPPKDIFPEPHVFAAHLISDFITWKDIMDAEREVVSNPDKYTL
ncbi:hypothetical protein PCE1_002557 [Barthelona sp. PCE]